LILPGLTRERFLEWFRKNHPDLVIAHLQITVEWLKSIGVRVPKDIGYFNLNYTERLGPCAGLDLQPRRLGAVAVETVVGMMHRQERGVPQHPQTITLEAVWIEGPTVRPG
jgi:LacI family transcriptional regulator